LTARSLVRTPDRILEKTLEKTPEKIGDFAGDFAGKCALTQKRWEKESSIFKGRKIGGKIT
jgi:hypothetical protein